ncbi:MAG TPA: patatin-like phospholipase family protein [Burkholderiaceae bacterium]
MTGKEQIGTASASELYNITITGAAVDGAGGAIDYRKLALVCEGGGQRGIFTAGVLDSFMRNNYFPFRAMVGVSAGAQNISAYACGARGYGRHAILRYTTQRAFFDPLRFARGGHLIDLDWYFEALHREVPLDLKLAQRRLDGGSLHVCASRCDNLAAEYLPFHTERLPHAVKASSAIPLFYRGGVNIDGVDYWDGGVSDALPVTAAHARGGDCIVVVRTLPHSADQAQLKLPRHLKYDRLQQTAAMVETHLQSYRTARRFIENPPEAVTVIEIAPSRPLKSRLLGSKLDALRHDYRLGLHCGRSFLDRVAGKLRHRPAAR